MSGEWKKGDILVSDPASYILGQVRVTFLAWSTLSGRYFIGQDEAGDVSDEWEIDDFRKEGADGITE